MLLLSRVSLLLCSLGLACAAWAGVAHAQALGGSRDATPTITKIDPPNWFAALPSPLLLVRGTGLRDAAFTVSNAAIHVTRTQCSDNGHWAMVWLDDRGVAAGTFTITARTRGGSAEARYTLVPRRSAEAGPKGFSSADVLYLIMPDRFADGDVANNHVAGSAVARRGDAHAFHGGDLKGILQHLDYLQQLGVTAIWLTPILQNDPLTSDYHGYGATDMYAVEPRFGTLAEYQQLAAELHRRKMKLVFDDVPNHVGQGNPWVADPPMPDWFHGTAAQHTDNQYVFGPITDPHAPEAASLDALDGWFVNTLPDMNQQNPVVAQYLTQNMVWWIEEAGIDGLRIDTFPYVQRDFWQQYLSTLKTLYPGLTSIGEIGTGDPTVNAYFAGGRTLGGVDTHLTTPFDYPLYYSLLDVLVRGKAMAQLEETLRQDWLYPHPEALVPFLSNHDQVRFLSQPGAMPALLRLGFGLLLTMRGMPQLYAGDEILMQGGQDPDNRRDFPGGFAGDPADAFTAGGRTAQQNAMHDWLAALGALRGKSPALQQGLQQTVLADKTSFAYVRTTAPLGKACSTAGSMLIVLNRDAAARDIRIGTANTALDGCRTLAPTLGDAGPAPVAIVAGRFTVTLPPFALEIFTLR